MKSILRISSNNQLNDDNLDDLKKIEELFFIFKEKKIPFKYLRREAINGDTIGIFTPTMLAIKVSEKLNFAAKKICAKEINKALIELKFQKLNRDENNKIIYTKRKIGKKYSSYEFDILNNNETLTVQRVKSTIKWTEEIIPVLVNYLKIKYREEQVLDHVA